MNRKCQLQIQVRNLIDKQKNFDAVISDSDPIGIITANFLKKKNIIIENIFSSLEEVKYLPIRLKQELGYQINIKYT